MTASLSRPPTSPAFLTSSMCAGVLLSLGCAASTSPSPAKDPAPASDPTVAAAPVCPSEGTWEVVSTDTSFHKLWRDDGGTVWGLGTHNGARGLYRLEGETWSVALDMSSPEVRPDMNPNVLLGAGERMVMAEPMVSWNVYERGVPAQIPAVPEDRCDLGMWTFDGQRWQPASALVLSAAGPDERIATLAAMHPFGHPHARGAPKPSLDETALATHLEAGAKIIAAHNAEVEIQREEEATRAEELAAMGETEEDFYDPMERFAVDQGEVIDPLDELLDLPPFAALGRHSFNEDVGVWRGNWGEEFDAALFAAQPGDLIGPIRVGKRVIVARLEDNSTRRPRPAPKRSRGACPILYWYGGWQAPSGVSYVAGSAAYPNQYPLGRIARVDGDEVRFMSGSCARTTLGSSSPDTRNWVCSPLYDVWGAAEDDLYAVGNVGHLVHFDGKTWSALDVEDWNPPSATTHDLNAIWGASDGGLVAVGRKGSIVQGRRGGELARAQSPVETDLKEVWGRSSSDVFAVGEGGTILHFDGTSWIQEQSGTELELTTVWGAGECDVMASSPRGVLLRRRVGGATEAEAPDADPSTNDTSQAPPATTPDAPESSPQG